MNENFGVFAAGALMVVCCLLPLVLIGAGSAGIAGTLAWFGGLDPILVLPVLGGGGILAYHVVRRTRGFADQREELPGDVPSALLRKEGRQGPWRIPIARDISRSNAMCCSDPSFLWAIFVLSLTSRGA